MTARARSSRSSSEDPVDTGTPSHLLVGTLGKPHGLKGELFLVVHSDHPARFAPGSALQTRDGRTLVVERVRTHATQRGERTVVSFGGIDDRTAAELLSGAELVVPVEAARPLGDDEWWDHDLVGCEVRTMSGEVVGTATNVLHPPANDVLVVEDGGREHLVPLVGAVVREVDVVAKRITIDPIPGLLD